ncbi:hypothetical protein [Candidatus Contubernalis alkaliaceticus]|uniref:hypothetical protein n=1 Tax=Candidatus Contubernalis alkaliaceticus TaxID=338645 RepID=UPI001F4C270F|nr:hypothetical protein [Candidatus Contubernalis alkalaceticus]UNC91724.1 hypothetical protein HUE98_06220 [Candidatus Contubernalis alkalaceticus]
MNINTANTAANPLKTVTGSPRSKTANAAIEPKAELKKDEYVPGNHKRVDTYGKDIARLKKKSEETYQTLRMIVSQLLERQGYTLEQLKGNSIESFEVDETARAEAAQLIADDGPLGPEAVSSRIVDFAIAISGGDTSKLDKLKGAIDKAFKLVEEQLGSLPEVSLRTYDMIMEKLDSWAAE